MEFAEYVAIARRRWWLLAASLVLGIVGAYAVSRAIPPEYRATATLLVVQQQVPGVVQLNDLQTGERLANTFSRLILLDPVLSAAADELDGLVDVEALADSLAVTLVPDTSLIEVTASHGEGAQAAAIANTVAETFIASREAESSNPSSTIELAEAARIPPDPASPRIRLNLALGGLAGLLVGGFATSLLEYRDDTVRNRRDVARAGLPTLGQIERFERRRGVESLRVALDPGSRAAEAYRGLRTTLTYALELAAGSRVLLVTSANEGEGKTTTVANLALAFGLTGRRTVIVDADLRRPALHELFGVGNATGLTNVLGEDELRPSRFLRATRHPNVQLVTAGASPLNPSELLGSAKMEQLLAYLRAEFDVVLLDTPPALAATDASVLAELADASLIVMMAGRGSVGELVGVAGALSQSARPVLGVVINRAARGDLQYGYPLVGYEPRAAAQDESGWPPGSIPRRGRPEVVASDGRDDESHARRLR